jgi:alpha-beta hydrolase superfamily lysophospholipase
MHAQSFRHIYSRKVQRLTAHLPAPQHNGTLSQNAPCPISRHRLHAMQGMSPEMLSEELQRRVTILRALQQQQQHRSAASASSDGCAPLAAAPTHATYHAPRQAASTAPKRATRQKPTKAARRQAPSTQLPTALPGAASNDACAAELAELLDTASRQCPVRLPPTRDSPLTRITRLVPPRCLHRHCAQLAWYAVRGAFFDTLHLVG